MSQKDNILLSDLDSLCGRLTDMEKEAKTKKMKTIRQEALVKSLTESIGTGTLKEKQNERKFETTMQELRLAKFQAEETALEGTKDKREEKEHQAGLLEASKLEVQILKQEMKKLKDVKMKLENYNEKIEEHVRLTNSMKDETDQEELASEEADLNTYYDPQINKIEKCLPELEAKATQLVLAASSQQVKMRRKFEILRDTAVEIVRGERDLKEIQEKKNKNDEKVVSKLPDVSPPVKEPEMIEKMEIEREKLSRLEESIQRKESEYKTSLRNFNSLLETQTDLEQVKEEKRVEISKLTARLRELNCEK